jgi:hypothetical protein
MKQWRRVLTAAVLTSVVMSPATAITIAFQPSTSFLNVGSVGTVQLTISGLTDNAAPSLGAFDLNVTFDPSILSFNGATFGDHLDLFGLGDIRAVTPGLGMVNLLEISLDLPSDLDQLQPDTFPLATLSLGALRAGTSLLQLSVNALGDANGNPLTAQLNSGTVVVVPNSSVGEPSGIALIAFAVLSLMGASCTGLRVQRRYF